MDIVGLFGGGKVWHLLLVIPNFIFGFSQSLHVFVQCLQNISFLKAARLLVLIGRN